MQATLFTVLSAVGLATAQGVTEAIKPTGVTPLGCQPSFHSNFEIHVIRINQVSSKSGSEVMMQDFTTSKLDQVRKRTACGGDGIFVGALSDSVIKDAHGRTGYIADNYQFQFDEPPQAGALITAGFSVCANNSLALGDSSIFYQCASGNFYNLYDRNWAPQCEPIQIMLSACDVASSENDQAGELYDGQVVATQVVTKEVVVPLSDGQPQVVTRTVPVPMCQITDGQVQVHTVPCAPVPTNQINMPPPVSEFSDGQIQVTPISPQETHPAVGNTPGQMLPPASQEESRPVTAPQETLPATQPHETRPIPTPEISEPVTFPTVPAPNSTVTSSASIQVTNPSTPRPTPTPANSAPPVSSAPGYVGISMAGLAAALIITVLLV